MIEYLASSGMRIKVTWPEGSKVLTLDDALSVKALREQIAALSSIAPAELGLRTGFPPQDVSAPPGDDDVRCADVGITSGGVVAARRVPAATPPAAPAPPAPAPPAPPAVSPHAAVKLAPDEPEPQPEAASTSSSAAEPGAMLASWDFTNWDTFSKEQSGFSGESNYFSDSASGEGYTCLSADWLGVSLIVDLANQTACSERQQPEAVKFEACTMEDLQFVAKLDTEAAARWVVRCSYITCSAFYNAWQDSSSANLNNVVLVVDAQGKVLDTVKNSEKASKKLQEEYDPLGSHGKFKHRL